MVADAPPSSKVEDVEVAGLGTDAVLHDVVEPPPQQEEEQAGLLRSSVNKSFDTTLLMTAYTIQSAGTLEEVPLKTAMASCTGNKTGGGESTPLWIDIEIEGDIALELPTVSNTVLDKLPDLTPFLRRHLADPTQLQTPQVLPLSQSALVVMRVLGTDARDTRHAAALCLPNILLTVTSSTVESRAKSQRMSRGSKGKGADPPGAAEVSQGHLHLQKDTLKAMSERELPEASVSGAAVLWFAFHLGRSSLATIKLRKIVYELIDKSEDIDTITLKDLNDCKDELLRFSSVAEEQLDCVQRLEGGDAMSEGLDFTSPILKGALSVILSTAGSTERAIGRLEKRVTELQTKYEANQQDKINSRLNVLTIISAVALPLTLLTGFWGMNWEHGMPAIRTQYGFWYALAGMIALGFALLAFFYRAGWMDCNRI
jgi:hypothetical protein